MNCKKIKTAVQILLNEIVMTIKGIKNPKGKTEPLVTRGFLSKEKQLQNAILGIIK